MGSENDLLSGRFLGINGHHQQIPGGFLGLNRNIQHPEPGSYPAVVPIDQMWPLMDMNSSIQSDRSVGATDCSMGLGSQKLFRPIPVMGNHSLRINVNSSDEDDPSFDGEIVGDANGTMGKKDKEGPWQRMKWTDKVVRFLIQVVSSVWEDGGVDGDGGADGNGTKQKSGTFKKGKWKTVSSILISKGYQASPQQCEDKFNDLNKRYKKLNDILGRGISCDVVENPGLLEKMSHLSPKAKEAVKKLLSSKHLFYREMCAYHNGLKITTPHCTDHVTQNPSRYSAEKNHSDDSLVKGSSKRDKDCSPPTAAQCSKEKDVSEDEEEDSEDDDDDDASEDDLSDNNSERGIQGRVTENHHSKERVNGDAGNGKLPFSRRLENLQCDMAKIFNDPTKSKSEQKEWIKKRMLQLEEERIGIQAEALELGKRRVKWQRFCDKKESELEMARLEKERLLLENERKVLLLKKTQDLEEIRFKRP